MTTTPLYERLLASGGKPGEYCGVQTPSVFSDVNAEFRALTTTCAIYDLGCRAKIVVTGEDRQRWMNGMVTNNIKDLPLNRGNYNFLLSPQGRIQGDLSVYNRGEYLLVDTDRSQLENILKIFDHYIIMDDVEVTDAADKITAIGLRGPRSRDVLKQAGIERPELPAMQVADATWNGIGVSVIRVEGHGIDSYEVWASPANIAQVWDALIGAGASAAGTDALEKLRVASGLPKYGIDIRERDLPQETGQERALNFTKGCYVGQEIVERIRSRGNVHRTFKGFLLTGETPEKGAKLQSDGKDVGEITSVNRIPIPNGAKELLLGLGYIRREALERGGKIEYPGGEAQPADTPFPLQ
jgi:folate-binding protein YgfZ